MKFGKFSETLNEECPICCKRIRLCYNKALKCENDTHIFIIQYEKIKSSYPLISEYFIRFKQLYLVKDYITLENHNKYEWETMYNANISFILFYKKLPLEKRHNIKEILYQWNKLKNLV